MSSVAGFLNAPGKAKSAKKLFDISKINPRVAEGLVGGTVGGGLGALTGAKKNKDGETHKFRNSLIGAGVGAIGAPALNLGVKKGVKPLTEKINDGLSKQINNVEKEFYDKGLNLPDAVNRDKGQMEHLYNTLYKDKRQVQSHIDTLRAFGDQDSTKKIVRDYRRNFGKAHVPLNVDEAIANDVIRKDFHKKYIENGAPTLSIKNNKQGVFDSIRNIPSGAKQVFNFKKDTANRAKESSKGITNAAYAQNFKIMFGDGNSPYNFAEMMGKDINEIKKTKDFKDIKNHIGRAARVDAGTGRKFEAYDNGFNVLKNAGGFAKDDIAKFNKILGQDINNFKTKDEVKKAFRKAAIKYHPDRNKSEEAKVIMAELNGLNDRFLNSPHYQKLADIYEDSYDSTFEKIAKYEEYDQATQDRLKGNRTTFWHDRVLSSLKDGLGGAVGMGIGSAIGKGNKMAKSIGGGIGYLGTDAIRMHNLHKKEFGEGAKPVDYAKTLGRSVASDALTAARQSVPALVVGLTNTPEAIIKAKKRKAIIDEANHEDKVASVIEYLIEK